ncbi:MAG TPA: PDZ domain-containing protein [Blastocatellia bacterium]|nr:PDZ domain-containing protein [Blastocatellia bacterium]
MANCRACSSEITGPDRYCRNCGVAVAPTVAEFDDTRRFSHSNPLPAVPPGQPDTTNPLYMAQSPAYVPPQGSAPSAPLALLVKLLLRKSVAWALISLMVLTLVGVGIGLGRATSPRRGPDFYRESEDSREQNEVNEETARRDYEIAVENMLGFKQGVFQASEFPEAQGIFVNHLMSDDSAAALAKIQAGDLLTKLNNQPVGNDSELSKVLDTLKTGDEVPVTVYREGATINLQIKIANRAFPPVQPKLEPRDQGFLGILDSSRRCCIPGTKKYGVEVRELHFNGPAELFGLRSGDVITEFNGRPVKTPNEFNRNIRAVKPYSKIVLTIYRGNTEQKIELIIGQRWEGLDAIMARRDRRDRPR